jgi:hypothetical protein
MGLLITVLRGSRNGCVSDCTMNGISSNAMELCLVNVEGPFEPRDGIPAAMLVVGNMRGTLRIVPAMKNDAGEWVKDSRWYMMGGNYAATSDSRFDDACEKLLGHTFYGAVAIHDRCEG